MSFWYYLSLILIFFPPENCLYCIFSSTFKEYQVPVKHPIRPAAFVKKLTGIMKISNVHTCILTNKYHNYCYVL